VRVLGRYPALAWLFVYVGSVFVLNGGQSDHGGVDAGELALGIGLIAVALGIGTWLAFRPWPGRPRPRGMVWLYLGVLAFYVVCAVAALAFTDTATAIATFLAGLIPLTAVGIWMAHTRQRSAAASGDERDLAASDHTDPIPAIGADALRPMGDSPEVHSSLGPHDLPKDHPARRTVERLTRRPDGRFDTTPGHR
jgi:hypothetical protein